MVSVIGSLLLLVGLCWPNFNAGQGSAARFIDDRGRIGSFEGNAGEVLTFKRKQKAQYKGPVTVEKLQDSYFTYKKLSENYGIDGEIAWRHEYSFAFSTLTGAFFACNITRQESPCHCKNTGFMYFYNHPLSFDYRNVWGSHFFPVRYARRKQCDADRKFLLIVYWYLRAVYTPLPADHLFYRYLFCTTLLLYFITYKKHRFYRHHCAACAV